MSAICEREDDVAATATLHSVPAEVIRKDLLPYLLPQDVLAFSSTCKDFARDAADIVDATRKWHQGDVEISLVNSAGAIIAGPVATVPVPSGRRDGESVLLARGRAFFHRRAVLDFPEELFGDCGCGGQQRGLQGGHWQCVCSGAWGRDVRVVVAPSGRAAKPTTLDYTDIKSIGTVSAPMPPGRKKVLTALRKDVGEIVLLLGGFYVEEGDVSGEAFRPEGGRLVVDALRGRREQNRIFMNIAMVNEGGVDDLLKKPTASFVDSFWRGDWRS